MKPKMWFFERGNKMYKLLPGKRKREYKLAVSRIKEDISL